MEQLYHPKNNIKVYVWIALVVASLLVAINGYLYFLRLSYLQQDAEAALQNELFIQELRAQRVDTSTWKTYTNEQYGFEFRYPQSFKLVTRLSDTDPYVYLEETDRESIGTEGRGSSILFVIHSSHSVRNLDDYFEQMKLKPFSEDMMPGLMVGETISNVSKSMFNNYQAILYNQSYFASSLKNILIWKDNIVYEISISLFGTKFGDGKLHDQIISTFKFINTKAAGILTGKISIGPNCPVERVGVACTPSPEAYASREFIVLDSNQKEVTRFHADVSGSYTVTLSPGTYTVVSAQTGMGYMSKDLPNTITINAGQTTTLNINIDTGIR